MAIGCSGSDPDDRLQEVAALRWSVCGWGSFRWWETTPAEAPGPRAVVIWLRDLGRVVWWIADGEETLGLGYVGSLLEPGLEQIHEAKQAAQRCWAELGL